VTRAYSLRQGLPPQEVVETLYKPFVRLCHGKSNWQVWGAKFWHFLNHNAFPIEDSRADKFFGLAGNNSVKKYIAFLERFRSFALAHQDWLPPLRKADGGYSCCDNKLWDKVCYGVVELENHPAD